MGDRKGGTGIVAAVRCLLFAVRCWVDCPGVFGTADLRVGHDWFGMKGDRRNGVVRQEVVNVLFKALL